MQQGTRANASIVQNQVENCRQVKTIWKQLQMLRQYRLIRRAILNRNLPPPMWLQPVRETLKVRIWIVVSPQTVEHLKIE